MYLYCPPSPHPGEGSDAAQNLWTWWGALLLKKNCGRRRYGRPVQKLMRDGCQSWLPLCRPFSDLGA